MALYPVKLIILFVR